MKNRVTENYKNKNKELILELVTPVY